MSVRTDLAAEMRSRLDAKRFDVKLVADLPDTIAKATVLVQRDGYDPAPNPMGTLIAKFKVILVTHHVDIEKAEDALETLLPEVLEALVKTLGFTFTKVEPVTVKDKYRGDQIYCSTPTANLF